MTSSIWQSRWPDSCRKMPVHTAYLALVVLAIILSIVSIGTSSGRSRNLEILVIAAGAKSIVVVTYHFLAVNTDRFSIPMSFRACVVLYFMEIIYWFVAVIVGFVGVSKNCPGSSCGLGVVVSVLTLVLLLLAIWLGLIAVLGDPYHPSYGTRRHNPKMPASEYN